MQDVKTFANETVFSNEMLENKEYMKLIIRDLKINALHKVLDETWHNRFWVIRFNEEWRELYDHPYGNKALQIRLDISEAQRQQWVVPDMPEQDYYAGQIEHKKKGLIIRIAEKIEAHFDHGHSIKKFNK